METSLILSQALEAAKCRTSLHRELLRILKPFEEKSIDDFLCNDDDECFEQIDCRIQAVVCQAIRVAHENGDTEDIVKIINVAKKYLNDGIQHVDVRYILIYIWLDGHLNIGAAELSGTFDRVDIERVSNAIVSILSRIKFEIIIPSDAPSQEREMLKKAEENFANGKLDGVYDFIMALERGRPGIYYQSNLPYLIRFLYYIDFNAFINYIRTLNSVHPIVYCIKSLHSTAKLINIANEDLLTNKWLNFELLRHLIKANDLKAMRDDGVSAIYNALYRIKIIDVGFFKQAIRYFHRRSFPNMEIFDESLGLLLASSDPAEMVGVVEDSFEISKYDLFLESRNILMDSYRKNSDDDSFRQFLQAVFYKWRRFLNGAINDEEFYANELIYTDYANFVIGYHTIVTTDGRLVDMIRSLLDKICNMSSEWAASKSNQQTRFHLYVSELLLLAYAYRNKEIKNPQINRYAADLPIDPLAVVRYNLSDSTMVRCHEIIEMLKYNAI